jgi:hypothetical protein
LKKLPFLIRKCLNENKDVFHFTPFFVLLKFQQ